MGTEVALKHSLARRILLMLLSWVWFGLSGVAAWEASADGRGPGPFHGAGTPRELLAFRDKRAFRLGSVPLRALPPQAQQTIRLIQRGGPYPYSRDGIVFSNREGRLPRQARGYYHEFTVPTPGERTRGARRIISGQTDELYYTDDHYRTFRRVVMP